MGFWMVEAIAGFIENIISFLFIGDVLGVEIKKYRKGTFLSVALTVGLLLINRIQLFSAMATLYGIVGISLCVYFLYGKNIWDILVAVVSYFLLLYLSEFLLISLAGILLGKETFGADIIAQQSWIRVLYLITTKVVLILLYTISHRFLQKIVIPSRKILIGVFVAFWLIFDLVKQICRRIDGNVVGTGILLLLIVAMGIYLMMQYSEMKKQKLQMEMTDERNSVMLKGYEAMLQNYRSNAVYYHDLKNHMVTIERYLRNGEYEKAAAYMKTLQLDYLETDAYRWTGIDIIDFILNYKKKIAEQKGISFQVDADLISVKGIEEKDLCALFGNLLDNAVEGCEQEKGEKKIRISIRRIQEMLVIKSVNSCKYMARQKNGLLLTTKNNKNLHGWGMKSMKMIVDKYGGSMQYSHKDGEFSIVLTFFL